MRILSFSGFIPEQICDTERFISYDGDFRVSHYCSYAADFISRVLADKEIDGAVFPRSCDSSRTLSSYLSDSGKFIHQLHVPARRDPAAVRYLAGEIRRYRQAVEEHYGTGLTDIPERAEAVNRRNRELAGLYEELPGLSYSAYLTMLHRMLALPLAEQKVPGTLPKIRGGGA